MDTRRSRRPWKRPTAVQVPLGAEVTSYSGADPYNPR
ncbi:pyrroloquinoline quinone precursor peptide PqqA [Longispora sp. K20-0274]